MNWGKHWSSKNVMMASTPTLMSLFARNTNARYSSNISTTMKDIYYLKNDGEAIAIQGAWRDDSL
uniref:DUF1793 domain-containing protein n=1 Tax=Ascaris lumbricoides TaxID=6252 RepID=A0A0M3IAQ1_ASCLU